MHWSWVYFLFAKRLDCNNHNVPIAKYSDLGLFNGEYRFNGGWMSRLINGDNGGDGDASFFLPRRRENVRECRTHCAPGARHNMTSRRVRRRTVSRFFFRLQLFKMFDVGVCVSFRYCVSFRVRVCAYRLEMFSRSLRRRRVRYPSLGCVISYVYMVRRA